MNVIAIAIAVFSVGSGAPLSAYIIAAVQALAINIAINITLRLLIKLGLSSEAAGVLTLVLVMYGGTYISGGVIPIATESFAINLLTGLSYAFQMYSKVVALNLKQLQKEAEDFFANSQEKQLVLKQAKELLDGEVFDMDLELLIGNSRSQVFIKLGEKPEDFLARSPLNVTQLSKALVENYVDIMLQPPSLADMLNQSKRGDDYAFIV